MEKQELDEVVGRARVALANGNWDESKHPRGADGRFGHGSGGTPSKPKDAELDAEQKKMDDAIAAGDEYHPPKGFKVVSEGDVQKLVRKESSASKKDASSSDPKKEWAEKLAPVVAKSRVALISQLSGDVQRHKIEEFESKHGKGSYDKLARQYGFGKYKKDGK